MTRSALVIGYGSIGARHARLLAELGVDVACVTRNADCPFPRHESIADALAASRPEVVVIANPTADHAAAIAALARAGFAGHVLVEKPLTGGAPEPIDPGAMTVFVAYNLRFHPLVQELKRRLDGAKLLTASFHAGQYLPDWRPRTDYRKGYSASLAGGGGVLRDLSHELDLACWFCGPWMRVAAIVGRVSALDIETDDAATLLLEARACPAVTVSVNYLERAPRRLIALNGERDGVAFSAMLDLVAGRLWVDGVMVSETKPERDETYRAQLQAVLSADATVLCSLASGAATDRLIAAASAASKHAMWVGEAEGAILPPGSA